MKKICLSLVVLLGIVSAGKSQDTVRYGDPWYQFYPLPPLIENSLRPCSFTGTAPPCEPLTESWDFCRSYFGYLTDRSRTIYGIAVVMDSLPGPEFSFMAALLRGFEYHSVFPFGDTVISVPGFVGIDTCYQEDSVKTWEDPLIKQCRFEYFYDYDPSQANQKTASANCFEFYFDTPVKADMSFADTFFVGTSFCLPYYSDWYRWQYHPKPCISNTITTSFLEVARYPSGELIDGLVVYHTPSHPCPSYGNTINFWGGVFPIVERRCSVPRGLTLSADSLSASWRSDTDAELFQLSVCNGTADPDAGLLFSSPATSQALPPFHRDSTYRLYLRKMCDFRLDTVWSDWSAPLVIAARPSEGIGEIQDSKFEIQISPNPATKQVLVTSNVNMTQIDVYDEQGRLVKGFDTRHSAFDFKLDVSTLPAGTYLLRISTPTGVATKKLLIQ